MLSSVMKVTVMYSCDNLIIFSGLHKIKDLKALVVREHFESGQLFHPSSQKILVHKDITRIHIMRTLHFVDTSRVWVLEDFFLFRYHLSLDVIQNNIYLG